MKIKLDTFLDEQPLHEGSKNLLIPIRELKKYVEQQLYPLKAEIEKEENAGIGQKEIIICLKPGPKKPLKFKGYSAQLAEKMANCFIERQLNYIASKITIITKSADYNQILIY